MSPELKTVGLVIIGVFGALILWDLASALIDGEE